jgi:hypothetical protein
LMIWHDIYIRYSLFCPVKASSFLPVGKANSVLELGHDGFFVFVYWAACGCVGA